MARHAPQGYVAGEPTGLPMTPLHAALDALPDTGLGPAESRLMAALFDADGSTETALARRVAERRAAVVPLLDALTRRGLVEQAASRVWLTAGGFALRRAAGSDRPARPYARS